MIHAATTRDAPLLDEAHLDAQTFGDVDLAREVLGLFRAQAARLMPLVAAGEGEKARRDAAHTLKGSARGIGAMRVAALAEACEHALHEGRAPDLEGLGAAIAETDATIATWLAARAEAA